MFRAPKVALVVKNLLAIWEIQKTWVWSLGWEDPWSRKWQPTPVLLPGNFRGQRSLEGRGIHGAAKSWTRLHTHTQIHV